MVTFNLLVWSEQWRRNDRRVRFVRLGFFLSVMVMVGMCGRGYFLERSHKVEKHIEILKTALNEEVQKQNFLEKMLDEQKERVNMLERKKLWRQRFVCHEALLQKMADILPYSVRIEMIKVKSDEWSFTILAQNEIKLKEFLNKIASVEGLVKIQVRQIKVDDNQVGIHIEFVAKVNC